MSKKPKSPQFEAVWRVTQNPSDRSWTITDDLRPGFKTSGKTLQDAVEELMGAMARWDQASDDAKTQFGLDLKTARRIK